MRPNIDEIEALFNDWASGTFHSHAVSRDLANQIPALIAEIRRLRERVGELEAECIRLDGTRGPARALP